MDYNKNVSAARMSFTSLNSEKPLSLFLFVKKVNLLLAVFWTFEDTD